MMEKIVFNLEPYVKKILEKYNMYDEETKEMALSDLNDYVIYESENIEQEVENILLEEDVINMG